MPDMILIRYGFNQEFYIECHITSHRSQAYQFQYYPITRIRILRKQEMGISKRKSRTQSEDVDEHLSKEMKIDDVVVDLTQTSVLTNDDVMKNDIKHTMEVPPDTKLVLVKEEVKVVRTPEKPRTTSVAPITPVTPEATFVITVSS